MRTQREIISLLVLVLLLIPNSLLFANCLPVKIYNDIPTIALNLLAAGGGPTSGADQELNSDQALVISSKSASQSNTDDDADDLDSLSVALDREATNTAAIAASDDDVESTTMSSGPSSNGSAQEMGTINRMSTVNPVRHLPNGQLFQQCNENVPELNRCNDENAKCVLNACVCKPGFISSHLLSLNHHHHQASNGLASPDCQSIRQFLNNCENDLQCQAFDVDLICVESTTTTKLQNDASITSIKSYCDCPDGSYFDQDNHTCLPCSRSSLALSVGNETLLEQQSNGSTTASTTSRATSNLKLRPCKPTTSRRRLHNHHMLPLNFSLHSGSIYETHSHSAPAISPIQHYNSYSSTTGSSASDPLRIRTPLEVFMGAIMLFTLITVAWFFLQRMIHDCRAIMRSLRNPEFATATTTTTAPNSCSFDQNFIGFNGGPLTSARLAAAAAAAAYFDPNLPPSQQQAAAVARLLNHESAENYTSLYQRDLAGVMVQHLTANLSPSSTSHTLVANGTGANRTLSPMSGIHEQDLYPMTSSHRNAAAAAAAAQLLLSPTHSAIAILRAAAAHSPNEFNQSTTSQLLTSMFDPPPKYEEAIAQTNHLAFITPVQEANNNTPNTEITGHTNPSTIIAEQQSELGNHNQEPNIEINPVCDETLMNQSQPMELPIGDATACQAVVSVSEGPQSADVQQLARDV